MTQPDPTTSTSPEVSNDVVPESPTPAAPADQDDGTTPRGESGTTVSRPTAVPPLVAERERLEAEVARRAEQARRTLEQKGDRRARTGALGGLGRTSSPARPARQWSEEEVRAFVSARRSQVPPPPADVADSPPEDPRAAHMTEIFERSLNEADLGGDVAQWRLEEAMTQEQPRLRALSPDQHPRILRHFIDQLQADEPWLTMWLAGRVGPGKTSAALAMGWYAVTLGRLVRVVDHADYLAALLPNGLADRTIGKDAYREKFIRADLLILDDLGAELVDPTKNPEGSAHVRKETRALLGRRVTAGRATVITCNQPDEDLAMLFGDRNWSRMQHMAKRVEFTAGDRRSKLDPLRGPRPPRS